MPDKSSKFYLTTPIYYVNARPHIGHAYTTLVADTIARRHRLLGNDTFFLTGTDEHGQKIERSAAAAGVPPQQFTDEVAASFRSLWDRMGLTYDDFIRTTEPRHKQGAQRLFALLHQRGQIYLSTYTGQYSVGEEMFVEGPPGTIGPDGKPTETVTEENFFFKLSEFQLPLLNLIESNELNIQPPARRNEILSFLRGDAYNENAPGERKSTKLGKPYIPGALRDLSVSRSSFTWGIPVPEPAASETQQKHVIYVWLDALANYMTALGYGSDAHKDIAKFEKYWPADLHLVGKEIIRFHCVYWPAFLLAAGLPTPKAVTAHGWLLFDDSKMSKSKGNIVRTETILDAFGTEVYAKQFPESTKREQDLFATDVLRYHLLREVPFGQDGSFSFDAMITRYNADLANGYGNLVSRVLPIIQRSFNGAVPQASVDVPLFHIQLEKGPLRRIVFGSETVRRFVTLTTFVCKLKFPELQFSSGRARPVHDEIESLTGEVSEADANVSYGYLDSIYSSIEVTNGFFSGHEPWKLIAALDEPKLSSILYTAAEAIRIITALLYPILPNATAKVWAQLGLGNIEEAVRSGELKDLQWGGLKSGTKLGPLSPIFPRADKGLAQIMTDIEASKAPKSNLIDEATPSTPEHHDSNDPAAGPRTGSLNEPNPGAKVGGSHAITTERPGTPHHTEASASGLFANSAAASDIPDTPQIAIDDFVKIDLRVAQIIVAERIPKADKLLRLEVDLGYEKRQILSGIAEWYTPEELLGKKIVVIANLAPRKMRGLESHGMLLAASHGENGKPVLATFGEEIALGSRLK